ncbi:FxsA family protein [Parasedimentitalea psychrophila]|uniref:FxsA family protein n=1 Tax=Parasedimentitalea psychrophila TaxID=2997337 RepID=A0A9Y2L352_9RHOB|nr:FxsA family protein [Parasedimentitalea psychrophila]WIY26811.1 FxsA family protein [Parasedimentitalea psychrophila]
MYLLLAFLLVPIIEIALFIQVGGIIGLWPTLAIVVLTAVLGTWLVKSQGRMALGKLQSSFQQLDDPTEPLAHGAMILVAGALLLTPGFFTDAVGFSLLMPPVRMAVFRFLSARVTMAQFQMGAGAAQSRRNPGQQGDIIDGDYQDVTPKKPRQGPSGWVDGPDQG